MLHEASHIYDIHGATGLTFGNRNGYLQRFQLTSTFTSTAYRLFCILAFERSVVVIPLIDRTIQMRGCRLLGLLVE